MIALLNARDQRYQKIKDLLSKYPLIITIKPNTPGEDKQTIESYILVKIFYQVIKQALTIKHQDFQDNGEGPVFLLCFDSLDPIQIKKQMIDIESHHPLGRLIDLDVFASHKSISRKELGYPNRMCYLCHHDAHICARNQNHTVSELQFFISNSIKTYIKSFIMKMIDDSIMSELDLEYKFGCVTKTSSGSHIDMNYELMIEAKQALLPYFIDIFFLAFNEHHTYNLFSQARKIGKKAEIAMLHATNGVNAYKGLIFILGCLLLGMGLDLSQKSIKSSLFQIVKDISKPVENDFLSSEQTFGMYAFKTYQIKGARGEVLDGFPTLQDMLIKYKGKDIKSDHLLRMIFIDIILTTDDTVLLKRSKNMKNYQLFKEKLRMINPLEIEEIKELNKYAIDHHLSQGGSADLLVSYLCLTKYYHHFSIN